MRVKRLHDEADRMSVQLVAKIPREQFWFYGRQQLCAGGRVPTAACCVQGLAELVGAAGCEVDAEVVPSFWNVGRLLVTVYLWQQRGDLSRFVCMKERLLDPPLIKQRRRHVDVQ